MPELLKVGVFLSVCKNTNVDMKWGLKHQPNSFKTTRQFSLFATKNTQSWVGTMYREEAM